jgi:hypothetical protein
MIDVKWYSYYLAISDRYERRWLLALMQTCTPITEGLKWAWAGVDDRCKIVLLKLGKFFSNSLDIEGFRGIGQCLLECKVVLLKQGKKIRAGLSSNTNVNLYS